MVLTLQDVLVGALKKLEEESFQRFLKKLSVWKVREEYRNIPIDELRGKDPEHVAGLINEYYHDYGAEVTLAVLEAIGEKNTWEELQCDLREVNSTEDGPGTSTFTGGDLSVDCDSPLPDIGGDLSVDCDSPLQYIGGDLSVDCDSPLPDIVGSLSSNVEVSDRYFLEEWANLTYFNNKAKPLKLPTTSSSAQGEDPTSPRLLPFYQLSSNYWKKPLWSGTDVESPTSNRKLLTRISFINNHLIDLIRRITNGDPVIHDLYHRQLLTQEQYDDVMKQTTSQEKMNKLFDIIRNWRNNEQYIAYEVIKKHNEKLIKDLEEEDRNMGFYVDGDNVANKYGINLSKRRKLDPEFDSSTIVSEPSSAFVPQGSSSESANRPTIIQWCEGDVTNRQELDGIKRRNIEPVLALPTLMPKDSSTLVPEQSSTLVPEHSSTLVPEDSSTLMPEHSSTLVPEHSSTLVPEHSSTLVPEHSSTLVPEHSSTLVPEQSPTLVPEHSSTMGPEHSSTLVPEHSSTLVPEHSSTLVPEHSSTLVPEDSSTLVPQETYEVSTPSNSSQMTSQDVGKDAEQEQGMDRNSSLEDVSEVAPGANQEREESDVNSMKKTVDNFSCKLCGKEAQDLAVVVRPIAIGSVYHLDLKSPGLYRCKKTGIKFLVKGSLTIIYKLDSWIDHLNVLASNTYEILGPLFNIKTLGEPNAVSVVYLPHFLCLKGFREDPALIKCAHFKDGKMTLETPAQIDPFYITLENPTFSLLGTLLSFGKQNIPIHGIVLIYFNILCKGDPDEEYRIHLYVLPYSTNAKETLDKENSNDGFRRIKKPEPTKETVYTKTNYIVTGHPGLSACPKIVKFQPEPYHSTEIQLKKKNVDTFLHVSKEGSKDPVWEAHLTKCDIKNVTRLLSQSISHEEDCGTLQEPSDHFLDSHCADLSDLITTVDPVLDDLLSQKLLSKEQYETVRKKTTTQEKMRQLCKYIRSWEDVHKDTALISLKKCNPASRVWKLESLKNLTQ